MFTMTAAMPKDKSIELYRLPCDISVFGGETLDAITSCNELLLLKYMVKIMSSKGKETSKQEEHPV